MEEAFSRVSVMLKRFSRQGITSEELLAAFPLLDGISQKSIERIISQLVLLTYTKKQVILLEQDYGSCVYFLFSGWIKIRTYDFTGKEIALNILGKGEIIGEMSIFDGSSRSTDAVSISQVEVGRLSAADFQFLMDHEPSFCQFLLKLMAARLKLANRRLQLVNADTISKVVDILLFLAQGYKINSRTTTAIIPNVAHQDIASLTGLTRETVCRTLTKLYKKGWIEKNEGDISIPDLTILQNHV